MAEELSDFLRCYKLFEYKDAIMAAGADDLGDLRDLNDDECGCIADEAKFKTLHKKKFIKACKALRDGEYKPQQNNKKLNDANNSNRDDDEKEKINTKLQHSLNSKYGHFNFQTKLPEVTDKNDNLENNIKKYLSEHGHYYKNWGDPILVCLLGKWTKQTFKENDKIEFNNRSSNSNIGGDIIKGQTFVRYYLKVSVVAFNEDQKENNKKLCNLTTFFIQSLKPDNNQDGWQTYSNFEYKEFDPRQLNDKLYKECINKYGEELVEKAHLRLSEITNNEQELIDTMKEIKRLHQKGLYGKKQKESFNKAKELIIKGVDPNLIIDEHEYRVLHYARYLNGSDYLLPFIKFILAHKGDSTLGPIQIVKCYGSGGNVNKKYHITPWYYYKKQDIMLKNGPLHNTIGGNCGGIICDHGVKKHFTKENGFKCDKCEESQGRRVLMYGCRSCNYDLCKACFNKNPVQLVQEKKVPVVTIGECNKNHLLIRSGLWGWSKAVCAKCNINLQDIKLNKDQLLYGCSECKYALCIQCTTQINDEYNNAIPIPNCSGKHGLDAFEQQVFNCSICKQKKFSETMYGCTDCKYDICFKCYSQPILDLHNQKYRENPDIEPPTDKNNHRLIKFRTPKHNYRCDECNTSVGKDSTMYGCRRCGYDLCDKCYEKGCVNVGPKKVEENQSNEGNNDKKEDIASTVIAPQCKGNHPLNAFKTTGSFSCDGCRGSVKRSETMYGCRKCNYDLCQACYDKVIKKEIKEESTAKAPVVAVVNCRGGHGLKQFESSGGYSCDKCKKSVAAKCMMYGCRKCNWDLCESCYAPQSIKVEIVNKNDINLYDEIIKLKETQKEQKDLINSLFKKQKELENKIIKLENNKVNQNDSKIQAVTTGNDSELHLTYFDVKEWKTWKADQFISWIISLNKDKYSKYYKKLNSRITSSVTPAGVIKQGKGTLGGWYGISDNNDRDNIWNELQKLISN